MLIDWFTVGAQILNFLILVWLLKRYLYGPILKAVDQREQAVRDRMREAEEARKEAQKQQAALVQERQDLRDERQALLQQVRNDVERWRENATEQVREEVDARRQRWLEALAGEQKELERNVSERVAREVLELSRRVLHDLGGADFEQRMIAAFFQKVDEAELVKVGPVVTVFTGADPSSAFCEKLEAELKARFPELTQCTFETLPELGFGLRLEGEDRRIEWTLAGYLDGLEERVMSVLSRPEHKEGTA